MVGPVTLTHVVLVQFQYRLPLKSLLMLFPILIFNGLVAIEEIEDERHGALISQLATAVDAKLVEGRLMQSPIFESDF